VTAEIKFCGLTRAEDAVQAAALGADYIGVIVAGGPRHQTPDGALRVLAGTVPPPKRVAVIAEQSVSEIVDLVRALSLNVVQLHADAGTERVREVREAARVETWAVIRVDGASLPPSTADIAEAADAIVLDARVAGRLGGTGVTLPWAQLAEPIQSIRRRTRIVLAGGLSPENVEEAIAAIAPDVVDVSSGVESAPGIKDHERMRAFRDAVHRAGAEQHG
jgi:phosphoribosylanthranilate isomerase